MENLNLKIAPKDRGYIVVDQNDSEYGPQVSTKKEAQELLADWQAYYGEVEAF